jgi:thiol:disulfide interchange protein DsbD
MRLPAFLLSLIAAWTALAVSPDELLEPEKAFRISVRALDERSVEVEFKIAPGYYMYRDRFSFATEAGRPLGEAEIPRGKVKEDQFFGKSETFRDLVRIRVPISAEDAARGAVNLKVTSQGCSDLGVCYTPLEQIVTVSLPGAAAETKLSMNFAVPWLLLAGTLAGGLGLGWASAGAPLQRDRTRRLARPAVVLWGFALAAAGALAGWLGSAVEASWIAAPLALAFVALAALWMHWSVHLGEFNWPFRAARDAAMLAAVLLLSFMVESASFGAAAALGAGLASGLFPKARSEAPHDSALQAVALAMLAAAVWVAAPLLPDVFRMLAWAAWLVIAGTLLRALDPLSDGVRGAMRLFKAVGVGALVWGVAVLIGALSGARDPLHPLAALRSSKNEVALLPVRFERVTTLAELQARVAAAGKPVMLDFYADWCVSCKEMEQFTFSDPQVRARMERMLLLQADVTRNTAQDKALLQRFRLFGPPGIVFFDAQGHELSRQRVIGYQPPERFSRVLDAVLTGDPS